MSKKIEIDVIVNQMPKGELQKVANDAAKMGGTLATVSKRDLSIFANQMLLSSGVTGRFVNQLSNLSTGLATGGFIGAGFAGAAALVGVLAEELGKADKATKELITSMEKLIKIQTPQGGFNLSPEQIPGALQSLKNQLEILKLTTGRTIFGGSIIQFETEDMKLLQEAIRILEDANKKEQQRQRIIDLISKAGLTYTEEIKKQNEGIQKQIELLNQARVPTAAGGPGRAGMGLFPGQTIGAGEGNLREANTKAEMTANQKAFEEMLKEREAMQEEFHFRTASVFRDAMNQAWVDIFGEANSLFEKLVSSWADMLFQQASSGLFSMLFGGFDIFGLGRLVTGGSSAAGRFRSGG